MTASFHLSVDKGLDKGREILVPPDGVRLGRSSKNDVVLSDPLLSRHHCRFFFKDGILHITDLGSANETVVNGKAIQEVILHIEDRVTIGDTVLRVVNDKPVTATTPAAPGPLPPPLAGSLSGPVVDLGLSEPKAAPRAGMKSIGREQLVLILCLVSAFAIAAWIWRHYNSRPPAPRPAAVTRQAIPKTVEIDYEKVEATAQNIFRYKLHLGPNRVLAVQIDDILNNRHLADEKIVGSNVVADLIQTVLDSGFLAADMKDEYQGVQPHSLNLWDLTVTLGKKSRRIVVRNHIEPEIFKNLKDRVEVFGKNELGLWAMQFSPEKILKMAEDSVQLARKLYDQKEIKNENLSLAISNLKKAHMDLRSIEPKPPFYAESLTLLTDCTQKLQEKFDENSFQSSRALNLKDWDTAAIHLRTILELIPDQEDKRHQDARKILLEIEDRQRSRRK